MKRSIRSLSCFAVLAMLLLVHHAAANPAENKDDGMIFQPGARFFFYPGKWSADLDIDKLTPVYQRVILRTNPAVNLKDDPKVPKGDYFVVCRGYLRVLKPFPARKITPGYRDSTFNVMKINGKEVHRKNPGDKESTYNEMYLPAGYHPYEIVWFQNKNYFLTMYGEPGSGREVWHKAPFEKRMQTELLRSFAALKKHIKGTAVLNDDQAVVFARLCKSAGADLRPLWHFWGRFSYFDGNNPNSAKAKKLQKFIDEKKLPASAKIYDTLVRYKSMVLKNNKEFQEFTENWWGRKPRIKGFCHESGHAQQWDSQVLKEPAVWPNGDIYDENSCARVEACIQEIIDMYFPNGHPKG